MPSASQGSIVSPARGEQSREGHWIRREVLAINTMLCYFPSHHCCITLSNVSDPFFIQGCCGPAHGDVW